MQALPESRQQTFEEIYGPPENFLEIEVCRNRLAPSRLRPHALPANLQEPTTDTIE
jgi:hypothetical protein